MRFTTQLRLLALALALATSACLVAVASRDTNAFSIDVHAGTMSGTLGSTPVECPYRLEPGASKARHWDLEDAQPARVQPIAQYDSTRTLFLDFGEEVPHNSNASPDVFRLVSLVAEPRAVSFSVSGAMAAFVTDVRLKDGASVLQGGSTESVFVKIDVPGDAQPGTYTGTLTVHVDGWTLDVQLPMTITVRGASPAVIPTVTPEATPAPIPATTPTADPTAAPTADPTAAPTADPTATPTADPTATPTAAPSPASTEDPGPTPTSTPSSAETGSGGGSGV